MALMKPIEAPRHAPCCTCRRWRREIGHALGACGLVPFAQQRDAEGRLVRSAHTRADEEFACHELRTAA